MPKEIARVHTVPAEHERQIGRAALAEIPDPMTVIARRDAAVARMRAAREALAAEIAGVQGIETSRGDAWSIMHVLAHVGKDNGGHFTHVYDVLERGMTELEPFEDRDKLLRRATAKALEDIDRAIAFATGLSRDDLVRHAHKRGRDHYVIGFVEVSADHLEEHLAQLREMRRVLADARERRVAAAPR
jgi:hypothetical protein